MQAVQGCYILLKSSLAALIKTFSVYDLYDSRHESDVDVPILLDAMSRSNRGIRSNRHCIKQSQKSIFMSEIRFEKDFSAVSMRVNDNRCDSSCAEERDWKI